MRSLDELDAAGSMRSCAAELLESRISESRLDRTVYLQCGQREVGHKASLHLHYSAPM